MLEVELKIHITKHFIVQPNQGRDVFWEQVKSMLNQSTLNLNLQCLISKARQFFTAASGVVPH